MPHDSPETTWTTTGRHPAARRSRPPNRRTVILDAAAEMFARDGYQYVGMSDIAAAVGVRPSALYRHFPGKQALLDEAVRDSVRGLEANLLQHGRRPNLSGGLLQLAGYAIDHRDAVTLILHEMPNLSEAARTDLQVSVSGLSTIVATGILEDRPTVRAEQADFLAWAAGAVLQSPAFHRSRLPRPEHADELAHLFDRAYRASLPSAFTGVRAVPRRPRGLTPLSRRELVLSEAIQLFAAKNYSSVSMEDIGARLGMAGPSVYNHFGNKAEILATALQRSLAYLGLLVVDALGSATAASVALSSLVHSYAQFAVDHPELVDLMVTEVRSLPEPAGQEIVTSERTFVAELANLLRQVTPDVAPAAALVRTHAALTIINTVARTEHLRALEGVVPALHAVCGQVLELPEATPAPQSGK